MLIFDELYLNNFDLVTFFELTKWTAKFNFYKTILVFFINWNFWVFIFFKIAVISS